MVAEALFIGTVITVNSSQPRANAVLVRDGRIEAVGTEADVRSRATPAATVVELGERALLPGFIEAHGHPTDTAIALSDRMVDIRPVTVPTADEVMRVIREQITARPQGAYFNGWDALLQKGLKEPTISELDELAPQTPVVIVHNSGHAVYFNSAAASVAGVTSDSPDPAGSRWVKDEDGALTGTGLEFGCALVLIGSMLKAAARDLPTLLRSYLASLNAVGITTVSDMSWENAKRPALDAARAAGLTARIRLYEMSGPGVKATSPVDNGDDLVRQIGIKTWADGSPWIGNIDLSFSYLDTPATRSIGIPRGSHGSANYTREELDDIVECYFPDGWQLACHVHGDVAVTTVLDAWEALLARHPRADHRLRLEHVGAMTPAQFRRAAAMGVTASLFINHVYYWGEVLVDDLFGSEHGGLWANARAAFDAGLRVSFHNDGTVTPADPLRNMTVGMTRVTRSGRHIEGADGVTIDEAIRAQTIDAAWQLFADDIVGSIEVGKYADLVVLSADPYSVSPHQVADLTVEATYLAGEQVFARTT